MNWKKVLGWTLFACGILGGFAVLLTPIAYIFGALGTLLELLLSLKILALAGAGIGVWWGWNLSHKDSKRKKTLKTKLGGDKVEVLLNGEENELLALDTNISKITRVFNCYSEIDKSVHPDTKNSFPITLQCKNYCGDNKEFCRKVVTLVEQELTDNMEKETRIDRVGCVDLSMETEDPNYEVDRIGMGQLVGKLGCFLKGHNWSQWFARIKEDKAYRYCTRCSKREYKQSEEERQS